LNWKKLSLVLLGLSVLLALLGGPIYGMGQMAGWAGGMMGMMGGFSAYGWMPMMGGFSGAFFLAGWLAMASFVSALVDGYRNPDKESTIFIGAVAAVSFVALFVPGAQWLALIGCVLALFLLWK